MRHSGWVVKLIQACVAHSEGKERRGDMRERMGWCPHRPCPSLPEKAASAAAASTGGDKVLHGREVLKATVAFSNQENHHIRKREERRLFQWEKSIIINVNEY